MGWNFSSADSKIRVTCVRILNLLAASPTYEALWTGTRFLLVYVHVPVGTQCDRAVERSTPYIRPLVAYNCSVSFFPPFFTIDICALIMRLQQ